MTDGCLPAGRQALGYDFSGISEKKLQIIKKQDIDLSLLEYYD